jgi:CheY-like chemotaxis protein
MKKSSRRIAIIISSIFIISIAQVSWLQSAPSGLLVVSLLGQWLLCVTLFNLLQNSYLIPLKKLEKFHRSLSDFEKKEGTPTDAPAAQILQPVQLISRIQSAFSELQQELEHSQLENQQQKRGSEALFNNLNIHNNHLSAELNRLNEKTSATLKIISKQLDRIPAEAKNSLDSHSVSDFHEQIQLLSDSISQEQSDPVILSIDLIETMDNCLELLKPIHNGHINLIIDPAMPGRIEVHRINLVRLLSFLIDIALQSQGKTNSLGLVINSPGSNHLCSLQLISNAEAFTADQIDPSNPEFQLPLKSYSENRLHLGKGRTAMVLAADPIQRLALKQRIQYFGCSVSPDFTSGHIDLFLVTSSTGAFFDRFKPYITDKAKVWTLGQHPETADNPQLIANLQEVLTAKFQQWSPRDPKAPCILLVDNESSSPALPKVFLDEPQQSLFTASNGDEAMALMDETKFSLALVDLQRPEQDSAGIAAKIKYRQPDLKVIGITSIPKNNLDKLPHPVFSEILTKPIDKASLERLLQPPATPHAASADQPTQGQLEEGIALPIFDSDAAIKAANGRTELAIQILAILLTTLPEDLNLLRSAWDRADHNGIKQLLHKLSGALEFTAATRLQQSIRQAGQIANQLSQGNIMQATKQVISEAENLLSWLQATPEPFKNASISVLSNNKSKGIS